MTQLSLLGRDNNNGLKHSVTAREQMEAQPNASQYPMPVLRSALGIAAEKDRLFHAEEALRQAQHENAILRKQLEETEKTAEAGYAEAYEVIQQVQKEQQVKKVMHPKIGFDHHESWWHWIKRVIFRS